MNEKLTAEVAEINARRVRRGNVTTLLLSANSALKS